MEDTLRVIAEVANNKLAGSLNPYSNGRYSESRSCWSSGS